MILWCLWRPLRGLARSHRSSTGFRYCAVLVGAGKPAKRPPQVHTTVNHRTFSIFRPLCLTRLL
ncbi:hypothetical protein C6A77_10370 [Pseudomonas sp. AFG_SD02_1510_Pfu_092]|nr:hypothetical protein C6A77_10370 [Pseudomonas sp. AFG_SD02_1510_Pfu_092]